MKKLIRCSMIGALAALLPAVAAARDHVTKWTAMQAREFMLNIADLPGVDPGPAQRRMLNGSIPQHGIRLDGGKGSAFVAHHPDRYFSRQTTDKYQSREEMDWRLSFMDRSRGKSFTATERRKIYRHGERGGWVYAVREEKTGEVCIVSRFGFLTDWRKLGSTTGQHYDTLVSFRDCSGKRSLDQVVKWVEGAKVVQ